ncbi:MAG: UvrD-helicase domain-containing protein [Firmicutes bacterium]|nr:UvrD-helicase domain-containing protein [Bacillota bacterium]
MAAREIILTQEQKEFVDFQSGCAILHAPVGSGKTQSIAERAAMAISRGVPPSEILCLTFTNRAAREMKDRILSYCGPGAQAVVVRTFHSLCAWMLRLEAKALGLASDFTIFDDGDSMELLATLLREHDSLRNIPIDAGPKDLYYLIEGAKSQASQGSLRQDSSLEDVFGSLRPWERELAQAYQDALAAHHALDFGDLVLYSRAMLLHYPDIRQRWMMRFRLIQVDEMQDTHPGEYEIISSLVAGYKNLVLAGDFDQTIYAWRGSKPNEILNRFQREFDSVRRFDFTYNHRATRRLLSLTNNVAMSFSSNPPPKAAPDLIEGYPAIAHLANTTTMEADWIADQIGNLRQRTAKAYGKPMPYGRIGILVRSNRRGEAISRRLAERDIPHLTVESFEFFRRQEVKDALAYLRFLLNPADSTSFRRMLRRPPKGIGQQTILTVTKGDRFGLRLPDMVLPSTLAIGDPFGHLLEAVKNGSLTVFDTETTGVSLGHDEIVELAALRIEQGREVGRFHRYLGNTKPVGPSEHIHGLSDDFLQSAGEDPADVLREFLSFAKGSVVVGHNVGFDIGMLRAYGRRLGLKIPIPPMVDTLDLARRFVDTQGYSLSYLAKHFDIPDKPTHHALDDVKVTVALLKYLLPVIEKSAPQRRAIVNKVRPSFVQWAEEIQAFKELVGWLRPAKLLWRLLDESGLWEFYQAEPRRIDNLKELVQVFADRDDPQEDPLSALYSIMEFAALAKNVDRVDTHADRTKILTIHQAKGLEFDAVFVAGLSEYEFPSYYAIVENDFSEEVRVFYVAITRARRYLLLSGHMISDTGRRVSPSRFFSLIGGDWEEVDSSRLGRFSNLARG